MSNYSDECLCKPLFTRTCSEVVAMKAACGPAHMKSILAIGELGSMNNVYKVTSRY